MNGCIPFKALPHVTAVMDKVGAWLVLASASVQCRWTSTY